MTELRNLADYTLYYEAKKLNEHLATRAEVAYQKALAAAPGSSGEKARYSEMTNMNEALHRSVTVLMTLSQEGETVDTVDGKMIVAIANHSEGRYMLTSDGGQAFTTIWADDPDCDLEAGVYFERYHLGVRAAHGYVDPVSRKMTQSG
jgi:hypothetical protein